MDRQHAAVPGVLPRRADRPAVRPRLLPRVFQRGECAARAVCVRDEFLRELVAAVPGAGRADGCGNGDGVLLRHRGADGLVRQEYRPGDGDWSCGVERRRNRVHGCRATAVASSGLCVDYQDYGAHCSAHVDRAECDLPTSATVAGQTEKSAADGLGMA